MPRRRAASFAGFFSKLFPSYRPEQGRTLRDEDNSGDSGYLDLGIKPEELTGWNIAEDVSPHRRAQLTLQAQERVVSPSPEKLQSSKKILDPRQGPGEPSSIPQQSESLSASQTHALLESKEKVRQERRGLKASGDFLPVTGYDPWSGEWNILTPTDTLSSDTTSPSMNEKMVKLRKDVLDAKQAYERAMGREESGKEKARLLKAQAKLAKIETKKYELKRQGGTVRWSRRGKNWSSAAQPSLSPIAQSVNSNVDNTVAGPSLANRKKGHGVIGNSSLLKPVMLQNLDSITTRGSEYCSNISDNTTIHTPARRDSNHVSFAGPIEVYPANEVAHDPKQRDSKIPFLWVRRLRAQDPGSPVAEPAIATSSLTTETNKRSRSLNALNDMHHFIKIKIPDSHLGIITPAERELIISSLSEGSIPTPYPLDKPEMESSELTEGDRSKLFPMTILDSEQTERNRSISAATVISSRSKLKELTRHPSVPQRLVSNQSAIGDKRDMVMGHFPSNPNRLQNFPADKPGEHMSLRMETANQDFASILTTTTITGCDPDLLSRSKRQDHHSQFDGHTEDSSAAQRIPISRSQDRSCTALSATLGKSTTASPCSTTPRDSQNSEYHLKVPNTDTTSAQGESPRKSYLGACFPKTPRARHNTSLISASGRPNTNQKACALAVSSRANPRRLSANNQRDFAVQAAARTILNSRKTAVSNPQDLPHTRSKSLRGMPALCKHLWSEVRTGSELMQRQKPSSPGSADTGGHSKTSDPSEEVKTDDAVTVLYMVLIVVINTVLATCFAWWNFVQPAFDRQSGLWRRRQKERSTLADLAIFLSAGVFCMAGALGLLRLLKWLVF